MMYINLFTLGCSAAAEPAPFYIDACTCEYVQIAVCRRSYIVLKF